MRRLEKLMRRRGQGKAANLRSAVMEVGCLSCDERSDGGGGLLVVASLFL